MYDGATKAQFQLFSTNREREVKQLRKWNNEGLNVYPGSLDPEREAKIVERWPFGLTLEWPLCQKPKHFTFSKISGAHIFHKIASLPTMYVWINHMHVWLMCLKSDVLRRGSNRFNFVFHNLWLCISPLLWYISPLPCFSRLTDGLHQEKSRAIEYAYLIYSFISCLKYSKHKSTVLVNPI